MIDRRWLPLNALRAFVRQIAKMTKDRSDYLELRAMAQQAVPEATLVETIREVLGRH